MKTIQIGSGIGGLASAIRLKALGHSVEVFEANSYVGGKVVETYLGNFRFDMGPSLFTLPQELDKLFEFVGVNPRDYFSYKKLEILCKYFFEDGTVVQAFSDPDLFAQELAEKTGEKSELISRFFREAANLYGITSHVFLERSLHKLGTYLRKETLQSILKLHKLKAFTSMHRANSRYFSDPRVVQLFDRYATYNGSNPYQAPATLNVISHLEHNLGAFFPAGGMHALTQALFRLAQELGVVFHFETPVEEILVEKKRVRGVRLRQGEVSATRVVSNMDVVPTYRKLLPREKAPERILNQPRSSSAIIFLWAVQYSFPDWELHNIFFSKDYAAEFQQIWGENTVPSDPTIYTYLSSKYHSSDAPQGGSNLYGMINVPANTGQDWDTLIEGTRRVILQRLSQACGVNLEPLIQHEQVLDPRSIERRTSSFQGALYGNSSNNPMAAFLRHPNFSQRIKDLYFVGGSVHPGGGIPLCLLSAKIVGDLVGPA